MSYSDRFDRARRRATVVLLATVACSRPEDPPEDTEESDETPWLPCGEVTTTEFSASDDTAFVVPGWTVAEALELVGELAISMEWSGWDPAYFSNPAPADPVTTLRVNVALDSATIRGYATEIDDKICSDWIDIVVDVAISTDDGILAGSTDALFTVRPNTGAVRFYFSADAAQLNLMTTWPATEPLPMPEQAVLRGETSPLTPGLGGEAKVGGLWILWVWMVETEGGHTTRLQEIVKIADFID